MSKYSFTLKNINTFEIEKKYNMLIGSFSTKISELASTREIQNFRFVDETMRSHSFIITFNNLLNKELPTSTNIHCFWCRHSFNTPPIGCPIAYISSILYKNYYSELNKDMYSIKGPITEKLQEFLTNSKQIEEKDFYITDGMFCSFDCCLSFINDNNDPLYNNSENLLRQYFYTFFNKDIDIKQAPSWRLLDKFGGHLTIDQFREKITTNNYINLKEIIKVPPASKFLGFLFEKKIKL